MKKSLIAILTCLFAIATQAQNTSESTNEGQNAEEAQKLTKAIKSNDLETLKAFVEKGSYDAAKALDEYVQIRRKTETYWKFLLDNSQKTGYDKYKEDVQIIQQVYQQVVDFTNAGKEERFGGSNTSIERRFPELFVNFYSQYPQYDKQGILKKARIVNDFNMVNSAIYNLNKEPYANGVETRLGGLISKQVWETDAVKLWFKEMDDAITACKKYSSGTTLNSYFKKALPKLNTKLDGSDGSLRKQWQEYQAAVNKSNSSSTSSSSGNRSSSSSAASSKSPSSSSSSSSVDIEKVTIPSYKFTTVWRKNSLITQEAAENKTGENQVRDIEFSDGIEGKIYRVVGSDGYWVTGDKRYETLESAVAAEYVYQKYGKYRETGRKH